MHIDVLDLKQATVVNCGPWALALDMRWTNTIVEGFEIVHIPRAPAWLLGGVNFEGGIVPVVDLALYIDPGRKTELLGRHHRLVLGGKVEASNESAVALLFSGLPMQTEYTHMALDSSVEIPEKLREICSGWTRTGVDGHTFEVRTAKLVETLALELM